MKNKLSYFVMIMSTLVTSCHCSNLNIDEFEGEYYDIKDAPIKPNKKDSIINDSIYLESKELKKKPAISLPGNVEIVGIPLVNSKHEDILLTRKAYTISYNKETKCPNWVAWNLTAEHADGELARSNDYREDYDVPAPRATNDDYKGSSWSRGHMCPAGDNKWDADAMSDTFLLTNMCPQDRSLNSGLWNRIEMDCRKWAQKYGDVYIVCGPVFLKCEHETIGVNKVFVPEAFFKVILCLQGKPKAIGFVVRNNEGKKKRDQFVNTVDDVERITGMDFFPALPDSVEDVVEAYANLDDWR